MDIKDIQPDKIYGSHDAALFLGCTRQNVCLQASLGRIEHERLSNGAYVITGRAILAYAQARHSRHTGRRRAMTLADAEAT